MRARRTTTLGVVLVTAVIGALSIAGPANAGPKTHWVNDNDPNGGAYAPPGKSCNDPGYASIQAAVNAAAAGDKIEVCAGTYNESVTVNKKLHLKGAVDGLTSAQCVDPAGSPATDPALYSVVDPPDGFDGFRIQAKDVKLEMFTVQGADAFAGVKLEGVSKAEVRRNVIQNNTMGVQALNVTESKVRENCIRENNTPGGGEGSGFYSDAALSKTDIEKNEFFNHSGAAINVLASPGPVTDLRVKDNRSTDDGDAVSFQGTTKSQISHNWATGCGGGCIALYAGNTDLKVDHNTLVGGLDEGIAVNEGPNTRLKIEHNVVTGNGTDGLNVVADGLGAANVLTISHNLFNGNGDEGIHIGTGNTGTKLENNNAKGNTGTDCRDDSTGTGTAGTGNTWKNNKGDESLPLGLCKA